MHSVPRWALISSGCAPVLLISGWMIAGHLEGTAYDPVRQTISVLAAYGAAGFWVMTGALFGLGVCHLFTAYGLRTAERAGRLALAGGGVAALVVSFVPAPSSGGSLRHGSVAAVGFVLLAVWPVLAAVRGRTAAAPWGLRPTPALGATAVMGLSAGWFLYEMTTDGAAGVAERVVTCMQAVWPLVVVASCLRAREVSARQPDEADSRP
ncbi:DUF998 domain-containing protein [Streptomyces sp. NPDC048604]|uniref:DUF998 domain-containing protein n=1 Tax=Streptomyces sp. NPDC048604 TaxID=3365578 RepID=UPI00371D4708